MHALRTHFRRDVGGCGVDAADQRLAKPPQACEVEVLLAGETIHAAHELLHAWRKTGGRHHRQLRFGEERQAVARQVRREFVEINRIVRHREIVVEQRAVGELRDLAEFLAQEGVGFRLRGLRLGEECRKRARRIEPGARIGDAVDVMMQGAPRRLPHVTARGRR